MNPRPRVRHTTKDAPIIGFKGLDQRSNVENGSMIASTNMSIANLPTLSQRPSRNSTETLTTANALYATNGVLCKVDGTTFYYNGVSKGTVTSGVKHMVDYNGKILIFPDCAYYDISAGIFNSINSIYTSATSSVSFVNHTSTHSVVFTTNTIVNQGGNWDTDYFDDGAVVVISDYSSKQGNNGYYKITGITTDTLTFAAGSFTANAVAANATFSLCYLKTTEASVNFTTGAVPTGTTNRFFAPTYVNGKYSSGLSDYVQITGCTVAAENNKFAETIGVTTDIISFEPSSFVASTETAAITVKTPFMSNKITYATVHDNRVFGVNTTDNTVYWTKVGNHRTWQQYSNIDGSESTGLLSGYINIGEPGTFTGMATYRNHVHAFKKAWSARLFGDNSTNYGIVPYSKTGPLTQKSVVEVNEVLYCVGEKDVYLNDGSSWESIGRPLNETTYSGAIVCGGDDRYYYASVYNGSAWSLYVYDTKGQAGRYWTEYDAVQVVDFAYLAGSFYALHTSDKKVYQYSAGSESVDSSVEFEIDLLKYSVDKWYTQMINLSFNVTSGTITIYDKVDGGSYTSRGTYTTTGFGTKMIQLKPQRATRYWIKVTGTGAVYSLISIYPTLVKGSVKPI